MAITPNVLGNRETEQNQLICAVSYFIMEWVLTAWSRLSTDVIAKSFKSCSWNLTVDESESHCLKKGQPCEVGAKRLEAQLSMLNEPNLPSPFQAITDSYINEANDDKTTTLYKDSDIHIKI